MLTIIETTISVPASTAVAAACPPSARSERGWQSAPQQAAGQVPASGLSVFGPAGSLSVFGSADGLSMVGSAGIAGNGEPKAGLPAAGKPAAADLATAEATAAEATAGKIAAAKVTGVKPVGYGAADLLHRPFYTMSRRDHRTWRPPH